MPNALVVELLMLLLLPLVTTSLQNFDHQESEATVVKIGPNATVGEIYAATQLRSLLNIRTLPLASQQHLIAVGSEASLALMPTLESALHQLGDEGFLLQTTPDNKSVAVTGGIGAPRGCMYGAYRFMELIGFDFLSSNVTNVPLSVSRGKGNLWSGAIHRRETPAFQWRHNNNANLELQAHINFSIALGNNNDGGTQQYTSKDVRKPGGGVRWAPPDFTETSFALVPPEQYFASHPEWFAGNCTVGEKGCHSGAGNQLCWGNQSLLEFIARRVIDFLRNATDATIVAVDQNDLRGTTPRPCMRPADLAIFEEEESWSGPLLRGVNYVADSVATAFPKRKIRVSTLAYIHTQDPPKKTVPRSNVAIRLVCHHCGYGTPLSNSTYQGDIAFISQLKGWGKITRQTSADLWIWTYNTDFDHWLLPWPDYYVVGPNTRLFIEHGATGAFQEGNFMAPVGDLQEMRSWVGQKLMWDPSQDDRVLIKKFLSGWFCGDSRLATPCRAAMAAQRHIDLISSSFLAISSSRVYLSKGETYTAAKNHYLTPSVLLRALTNLRAAQHDIKIGKFSLEPVGALLPASTAIERLQRIEMGSLYVLLLRWSEMKAWATQNDFEWPAEQSLDGAFTRFAWWYRRWGLDHRVGYSHIRVDDYGLSANPQQGLRWLNLTIHGQSI